MNERMKELAAQAGFHFDEYTESTQRKVDLLTELIVRECAKLIVKNSPRVTCKEDFHLGYVSDGYMDAADLIKQHFGVGE